MSSNERRTKGTRLLPDGARPPRPEGPGEIRKRFEDLNRRPPWNLPGHALDLLGRLDLKTGAAVVTVGEILNVFAGDFIERTLNFPFSGWMAFLLPLLLAFFHRKEKSKDKGSTASDELARGDMTPEAIAAAVESSRRSIFERAWEKLRAPE